MFMKTKEDLLFFLVAAEVENIFQNIFNNALQCLCRCINIILQDFIALHT